MSITNDLVITAMDRFVWFVLLIVMSHLVTEFTRVTGYARGTRNDVVLVNDTKLEERTVQNLLLYPGQELSIYDAQHQQQQSTQYYNSHQGNSNQQQQQNSQLIFGGGSSGNANTEQSFPFSFRPIIDSIFEIPISTLRAVNNLVARLTGGYRQAQTTTQAFVGKTANAAAAAVRDVQQSAMPLVSAVQELTAEPSVKKTALRELSA